MFVADFDPDSPTAPDVVAAIAAGAELARAQPTLLETALFLKALASHAYAVRSRALGELLEDASLGVLRAAARIEELP